MWRLAAPLISFFISVTAVAETAYIRDTLYVPLRGGQSTEHRILHRGLRSGTAVEVIETNADTGYSRVRTPDGLEGWLQTQYLVSEPVASDQLENISSQLSALEAEHQQTLLRFREAKELNDELTSSQQESIAEKAALADELNRINELAANVISIDEQNKEMMEERDALLRQIDELYSANEALEDDRAQEWFLRGAGTVMIGLLFGFWIGRRIYSRRNTGGWS